jgi:mannan endo-1,4-beta-mannosidase
VSRLTRIAACWLAAAGLAALAGCGSAVSPGIPARPAGGCVAGRPPAAPYLGVFAGGFPPSTLTLSNFQQVTGVRPSLITFYERFGSGFNAASVCIAVRRGAIPVLQIDPTNINLANVANGQSDAYLRYYATAIKDFKAPVIVSFGHEMNGDWYSWGFRHASPALFIATWKHIVDVFRAVGARNVTWLWTVNVINDTAPDQVANPAGWWPGSSYVNWVGIDGYYFKAGTTFTSLFGPTIVKVSTVTHDPILISETGVAPAAGQPAKIKNLFAGVRAYGLLGFIWFDALGSENWRITAGPAGTAFRAGALTFEKHHP